MTNKQIANVFKKLADLMELHGENPFKIRSYANAYITFRKWGQPLTEMTDDEIKSIKGVGAAIAQKTRDLINTGTFKTLDEFKEKTPAGIQEMLEVKGFGPKKILSIWKDLKVETIGELLYACNENRLLELKGFNEKTQDDLKKSLEYYLRSKGKFHYATLESESQNLINTLRKQIPDCKIELTGAIRRKANIASEIEILIGGDFELSQIFDNQLLVFKKQLDNGFEATTLNDVPTFIRQCEKSVFGSKWFRYTATQPFMNAFLDQYKGEDFRNFETETAIFQKVNLPFIAPELRESEYFLHRALANQLPNLIEEKDIKGVIHSHSTYSDGLHELEEMATEAQRLGYEYLVISDHSKSAFYANGLKEDRLQQQWDEIEKLNQKFNNFKIFKGIESDILFDGSLDYSDDILAQFDCIIASIHSNLKMDEEKATSRLIKAIENPYTHILGHPTGRLLLSRKGYPIDYQKVIDACAANHVAIELNAHPWRLDLDWTWIPAALEKGVKISINPDAHSKEGIQDIHFGVVSARKGGLSALQCLNTQSAEEFIKSLKK